MDATYTSDERGTNAAMPILATLVNDEARLNCLPRFFGNRCVMVENAVFTMMGIMCADYHGAFWQFFELSNGGFYMVPKTDNRFHMTCDGNGFEGDVSADAAGIIACLMAFSHLSFQLEDDRIIDAFHRLRDFASDHSEAGLIFSAID